MFTAMEISVENADTNNTARHIIFQPMKSDSSATYTIEIDNFKIEKGNKPTDWSLSPDDMNKTTTEVIVGTQTAVTGSWTGKASFTSLKDGQQIAYWLPYDGSGNASLNLTLADGTTTGAIACYYSGTSRITTHYKAGNVVHLTYRVNASVAGTNYTGWWADANYTDGNTYDRIKFGNSIKAKTAISSSRIIVGDDSGYFHLAASSIFDIDKPILWAGSNINANETGNNNYLSMPSCTLRNNTSSSWSATAYKTLYLVGTLSNNTFTVASSNFLTTTTPTEEDDLTYISLGYMISSYQMYLYPEHPIYRFANGGFKLVSQTSYEVGIDAKSIANTAQSTASSAQSTANAAQSTANNAQSIATDLNNWKIDFTAEDGEFKVGLKAANDAASAASSKADDVETRLSNDIASREQYMRYSAQADQYGNTKGTLELGDNDSKFKTKITNTELGFYEDNNRVSYINGQKMYITNAMIEKLLGIGNFGFTVESDNSVSFGKIK